MRVSRHRGGANLHPMSSRNEVQRGRFIVFEGGDGSGKSTQAKMLAAALGAELTREPGGTPISEKIRALVLDPTFPELDARTEALLMAASRAQHVAELIEPALARGTSVVSDRFIASSLAYQGVARGLGIEAVATANALALNGLQPDLTILLKVSAKAARGRLGDALDRIEQASLDDVVVSTYEQFAAENPDGWLVVEAEGSIEEVGARIRSGVRERLGL